MLPRKVTKIHTSVEADFNDYIASKRLKRGHEQSFLRSSPRKFFCLPNPANGHPRLRTRMANARDSESGVEGSEDLGSKVSDNWAESDFGDNSDDFLENWIQKSTFMRE